ncbi:uncharacterized protein LOC105192653 [Harpegnathos saltator]|nr:uncharacterized protein LOC105192653 [Harpegnathos saltator]
MWRMVIMFAMTVFMIIFTLTEDNLKKDEELTDYIKNKIYRQNKSNETESSFDFDFDFDRDDNISDSGFLITNNKAIEELLQQEFLNLKLTREHPELTDFLKSLWIANVRDMHLMLKKLLIMTDDFMLNEVTEIMKKWHDYLLLDLIEKNVFMLMLAFNISGITMGFICGYFCKNE